MVAPLGSGAVLAKYYMKLVFRLLSVHPMDFELLLGVSFEGAFYYYDKALPMGFSISCSTFEWCLQSALAVAM